MLEIPGVLCTTELHLEPAFKGKVTSSSHVTSCYSNIKMTCYYTWYKELLYTSTCMYVGFVCNEDAFFPH